MSMQVRVEALKKQLEQLFPGKWLKGQKPSRNLSTGIEAIDNGVTKGIARKRITEWSGPLSSGKTSLLRNAISHWCTEGLNVAYIDCQGKLYAADWASIARKNLADQDVSVVPINQETAFTAARGKFWILRPENKKTTASSGSVLPLLSRKNLLAQEAVWSADQFIRSNGFDVVILDLGSIELGRKKNLGMGYCSVPDRIYARLQRSLDKSKAALIIVSDNNDLLFDDYSSEQSPAASSISASNWGCHARFLFNRGLAVRCESGLNGIAVVSPTVRLSAWRDGLSQEVEVNLGSSVPNRLYTHSPIPDRRTSKG